MAPSITIVTAFFDIGRGSWTPENGHTPYFHTSIEQQILILSTLIIYPILTIK
ncbi:WlaTC/HtrL family glycosyltransferase [Pectobacterium versatile]|uniref:WlaTC/HtrL family glycosyltransferase n=1 Tax=Pectobacterium versatile TaxID=2488639 RepID=UPI0039F73B0B